LSDTLKIYQIRYSHYGITKWCYTTNFLDYYPSYVEAQQAKNRIDFKKEFYEKMQEMLESQKLL